MEDFVNNIINGEEFRDKFTVLYIKNLDEHDAFKTDFEKLKDFQPDLRSDGFSDLIIFLRSMCEDFEPDSTFIELNIVRESGDYS